MDYPKSPGNSSFESPWLCGGKTVTFKIKNKWTKHDFKTFDVFTGENSGASLDKFHL